MKLNFFALFTALSLSLLTGCKSSQSNEDEPLTGIYSSTYENTAYTIYNADNREIGSLSYYSCSGLVYNSILYTKLPESSYDSLSNLEYWLHDIDTGEEHMLGVIEDWSYEESYETTVIGDHLYMSISTGDAVEHGGKQTIYDVDLKEYGMTPILEIDSGIPYNSFTIVNDTLYVAELLDTGASDIIKLDLTDNDKTPVVHAYDEQTFFTKDSIRHITSDDEHIYMVRLHLIEEPTAFPYTDDIEIKERAAKAAATTSTEKYALYADTYDLDLNLLDSTDISAICSYKTGSDNDYITENDRKMWVADFRMRDAYMFYLNFNPTSFLGSVNDGNVTELPVTDFHYSPVYDKTPQGDDLFFSLESESSLMGRKKFRNLFFSADPKTGEIQKAEFYADNPKYSFWGASRNDKGMILLTMGYARQEESDEPLPDRLYFFNINELDFKPLTEQDQEAS